MTTWQAASAESGSVLACFAHMPLIVRTAASGETADAESGMVCFSSSPARTAGSCDVRLGGSGFAWLAAKPASSRRLTGRKIRMLRILRKSGAAFWNFNMAPQTSALKLATRTTCYRSVPIGRSERLARSPHPAPLPTPGDKTRACSPYDPVPLNFTECGLFGSLLVMLTVPVLVPTAVGVKVTFTVHEAPGPRLPGQLEVAAKSPLATILPRVNGICCAVIVTFFIELVVPTAWLGKTRLVGRNLMDCPVPTKSMVIGLSVSLLCTERPPNNVPGTTGLKLTLMVQLPPLPNSTEPQLLV